MTANFVPKRPHKKSRAGCKTCKSRKVKCDEAQPSCTFCSTRNLPCIYLPRPIRSDHGSPDASHISVTEAESSSSTSDGYEDSPLSLTLINPTSPIKMSSGNLSATNLRLMYHWSTFTYNNLGAGEHMDNVLRFVLPELAFENEFLLNAMLGIASLHRQKLLPDPRDTRKQTDIYRFKALSSFREAIAGTGANSPNYDAVLAMSIMLVVLCSQDYNPEDGQLTVVRWIVLYRGVHHIIMLKTYPGIAQTTVYPIFTRELSELNTDPVIPTILLKMLAAILPLDADYAEVPYYCSILDALGMLYASLREDGVGTNLAVRVMSWPSHGSDPFAKCAKENRPRALVILAHYLVFVKLVKGVWWLEGVSDREIKIIAGMVGPNNASYMEIPLRAAEMTDDEEIVKLLLT